MVPASGEMRGHLEAIRGGLVTLNELRTTERTAMSIRPILRIALAALCAGTLPATAALTPLSVNRGHRYLEDAARQPFFLVGDAPQNLPLKLAVSQLDGYMADCEVKGFNLLWICIDGQRSVAKTTIPPMDRNGNLMMSNGWDIGTLNPAYFTTIDAVVSSADRHNIYCMFTPLSECEWYPTNIAANASNQWYRYGRFLGGRYKNTANLVWQIGNDTLNTDAQHPIVQGIKDAGDTHLMTVNWTAGNQTNGSAWVRKNCYGESWIDVDAWYQNAPQTGAPGARSANGAPCFWQKVEYQRPNFMPTFQTEAQYQQPDPAGVTDLACRKENYYVALGGGCGGQVYGSGMLDDKHDYRTYINNGGRVQAIHFKNLLTGRNWTSLVPDYAHTFVTAGYGTLSDDTLDYVGAALNGGTLGMAYCPQAATITVNLSRFSGPVTARWYDPTVGTYQSIRGSPFPNAASHRFSTPGANREGDGDWALVLETRGKTRAPSARLTPPESRAAFGAVDR